MKRKYEGRLVGECITGRPTVKWISLVDEHWDRDRGTECDERSAITVKARNSNIFATCQEEVSTMRQGSGDKDRPLVNAGLQKKRTVGYRMTLINTPEESGHR